MAELHLLEGLYARRAAGAGGQRQLPRLVQQWDGIVRQALRDLGELLWPDGYLLGVVPIHHYRVRYRPGPRVHVWWVEHELPSSGRSWCAAYRVLLSLDAHGEPRLTVQSGNHVFPVNPLTVAALEDALSLAGGDSPLMIASDTGRA